MKNNSLITGAAALLLALTLLFSLISPAESSGGATQDAKLSPVGQIGGTAYDVYILGQYAYLVSGAAFAIFDVSNPAQPERLGYLLFPDKAIGVHAAGDYAYVVTESSLWVISTADKSNPVAVGQCALTGGTGQKVVAAGDYAYVAAYSGGLQTIQVSDPAHPTPVSSNTGIYGYSVYVSGGYLYLASRNLYIFSLADPAHPAQVGVYNEGERDVVVSGKYAYAIGGSLWVLDVSNPAAPTLVGEKDLSESPNLHKPFTLQASAWRFEPTYPASTAEATVITTVIQNEILLTYCKSGPVILCPATRAGTVCNKLITKFVTTSTSPR